MIPKIIHYCWFGGKEKPEEVLRMIASWKKHCPDYEIKEWNESNFNIHLNLYTEEAYQQKKWAFVSDVARLWALVHEGGIYMDTDVEVIKPFDSLLQDQAILGFEGTQYIATSFMGAEPQHPFFVDFLNSYNTRVFLKEDQTLDQTTNVEVLTQLLNKTGELKRTGEEQTINGIHLYPTEYFSPYDYITGRLRKTKNTYSIHWFDKSWTRQNKLRTIFTQIYHRFIGSKMK